MQSQQDNRKRKKLAPYVTSWVGPSSMRTEGGALPTRGVSSYRRLQKPEAWALRAYASFFVFTAEAALWERLARTNHASPGKGVPLHSDGIQGFHEPRFP